MHLKLNSLCKQSSCKRNSSASFSLQLFQAILTVLEFHSNGMKLLHEERSVITLQSRAIPVFQVLDVFQQFFLFFCQGKNFFLFLVKTLHLVIQQLLQFCLPGLQPLPHVIGLLEGVTFAFKLFLKDSFLLGNLTEILVQLLVGVLDFFKFLFVGSFEVQGFPERLVRPCHIQEWFDFCEQAPPLPVSKLQVAETVALYDADGAQLLNPFVVMPSGNVSTAIRLENSDDLSQFEIALFFKMCQDTSPEEDLGLTNTVRVCVQF